MSYALRGRGDLEEGNLFTFPADRRLRIHGGAGRVVLAPNPLAFLASMLIIFMLLNSRQSPTLLLWVGMIIFLLATCLRMFATWQQIHTQMQMQGALASSLGAGAAPGEIRVRFGPPVGGLAGLPRSRLHALGLQLAMLDRDLTEADYEALRTLDSDNPPGVEAMTSAQIHRLPTYQYKIAPSCPTGGSKDEGAMDGANCKRQSSQANEGQEKGWEARKVQECSVCLEQLEEGDTMRILPCLHQFHADCIDQWLGQQATCPVCKHRLVTTWQEQPAPSSAPGRP